MGTNEATRRGRLRAVREGFSRLIKGVLESDPASVEAAARELAARRKWLAPLAFAAGAVAMVVVGIKPLILNWRLTLVELVPAGWLWLSMYNLKKHVIDGRSLRHVPWGWTVPVALGFIGLSVLAYLCNAIFALSFGSDERRVRVVAKMAWLRRDVYIAWGVGVGAAHAAVALVLARVSPLAYDLGLSVVVGVTMVTYITVPATLAGVRKRKVSRRDKVAAAAVGGTIAAVVSMPGFVTDRIGLLMISTHTLKWLGIFLLSAGVALQMAATTSTRAVKLSTLIVTGDAVET